MRPNIENVNVVALVGKRHFGIHIKVQLLSWCPRKESPLPEAH